MKKDEGMGFPGGNSPPFWLSFPFLFFFTTVWVSDETAPTVQDCSLQEAPLSLSRSEEFYFFPQLLHIRYDCFRLVSILFFFLLYKFRKLVVLIREVKVNAEMN